MKTPRLVGIQAITQYAAPLLRPRFLTFETVLVFFDVTHLSEIKVRRVVESK